MASQKVIHHFHYVECVTLKREGCNFYFFIFFLTLQEEGWLTGVVLSSGVKGVFPANFTRPLT